MGLALSVGILVDLAENDPEGCDDYRAIFEVVNGVLAKAGLPAHHEPTEIDAENEISLDMYGYSGLHYLRRIAAHLTYSKILPAPGSKDERTSRDPFLKKYYEESFEPPAGAPKFEFNHLIQHSDAEGFYLPIDFQNVIIADADFKIPGQIIGSSQRLLAECKQLAAKLEIPPDIDPESKELWEASDAQGKGSGWKRYGIESFTCVRLMHACEASIRSGAAVTFC